MIAADEYFGEWKEHPDATDNRRHNSALLLVACAALESLAIADGVEFPVNPKTGSGVSGTKYGGFRPQKCPEGRPLSSHKEGMAVDRYDPEGLIGAWCMENLDKLARCGIYIEHPDTTSTWSHWTIRRPGSGNRAFWP